MVYLWSLSFIVAVRDPELESDAMMGNWKRRGVSKLEARVMSARDGSWKNGENG
jgi:hypothetical protein